MTEQFEMIDTLEIQLNSLSAVMNQIGYRLDRVGAKGDLRKATGGFITDNPSLQANRNIGLNTAVKIHNAERDDWKEHEGYPGWYTLDIGGVDICLNKYGLNLVFASKLVEKVKLVKALKSVGHILVQNHMVKPVDKEYIHFLGIPE